MIFRRTQTFTSAAKNDPTAIPLDQATVLRIVNLFRAAGRARDEGRAHLQEPVDYTGLVAKLHERVGAAIALGGDTTPAPIPLFDTELGRIEEAIRSLRCDGSLCVPGAHGAARAGQVLLDELHLRRGHAVAVATVTSTSSHTVHVFPAQLTTGKKGNPP